MNSIESAAVVKETQSRGTTYGGQLVTADGRRLYLPDIHPDPAYVNRFLQRLIGEEADETQIGYYLEDFLAENGK